MTTLWPGETGKARSTAKAVSLRVTRARGGEELERAALGGSVVHV